MSNTQAPDTTVEEQILKQARAYREGFSWLAEERPSRGLAEPEAVSTTAISDRAFEMIVFFEVTSKQVYILKYQSTIWPGEESGVTIGIGYDVGYATRQQLRDDWAGAIPPDMIARLETAVGVTGLPAKTLAASLRPHVTVPWDAALSVHRTHVLPRWIAIVEDHLQHTSEIGGHCLGALTSLTYNRGASYEKPGDRYREMRAIKRHMADQRFDLIPAEIQATTPCPKGEPRLDAKKAGERAPAGADFMGPIVDVLRQGRIFDQSAREPCKPSVGRDGKHKGRCWRTGDLVQDDGGEMATAP
jgi:hypothetical protein